MKIVVVVWILLCSYLDNYLDGCKQNRSANHASSEPVPTPSSHSPKIITHAETLRVKTGDSFNLTCDIDDLGTLQISWIKNNTTVVTDEGHNNRVIIETVENGSRLLIDNAEEGDTGEYTCKVLDEELKHVVEINDCLDGWTMHQNKCFYTQDTWENFSSRPDKKSWPDSRKHCDALWPGADLARLDSEEEKQIINDLLRVRGIGISYWIGGHKAAGGWRWVDNNSSVALQHNWRFDEDTSGDCIAMGQHSGLWYDIPCHYTYSSVCMRLL